MSDVPRDVLDSLRTGRQDALDEIVPLVYEELRAIAHRHLRARGGGRGATLVTTALVNEAYLKLVDQSRAGWRDRAHFLALAAVAMRHILTDRARARVAVKRGGGARPVTLEDHAVANDDDPASLLEIDDALRRLAEALGVTARTVRRDWTKARMLLRRSLEGSGLEGSDS